MDITRKLTAEIKEILEYNPITGEFFWKVSPPHSGVHVGDLAGSVYPNGYRYIQYEKLDYEDPIDFIDHKDLRRDNNSFDNLRKATNSQNQANAFWSTNTSGIKGVRWERSRHKWTAFITVNNKATFLGRYAKAIDAALAYRKAAIEAWGEFALVPSPEELEVLAAAAEANLGKHEEIISNLNPQELGL